MPEDRSRPFRFIRLFLWAVVLGLLALVLAPYFQGWLGRLTSEPRPIVPRGELAPVETTIIQIFEQVSPSVVYISTAKQVLDPWTRSVFEIPRGTGSGFIWDEHGHVVTNNHVIAGASTARVRLADQRTFDGVLVGASETYDLAVLRIPVTFDRPPPVPLGTSADLQVGQLTLAIGNPFGLDHTLTTGVVSALDRTLRAENDTIIRHLIQTDAAINPGNSGGPLIDSAGRLIGINTAIYSPSGAFSGIGFAVPVDMVNRVVPELIRRGGYVRPALGITIDDGTSRKILTRLDLEGVLVLGVEPGSAAERAGLTGTRVARTGELVLGDIILAVDGEVVTAAEDLLAALDRHAVGDRITLRIWRDGQIRELPVVLQAEG